MFLGISLVGALMFDYTEVGWWLGHGFELVGLGLVGGSVAVDLRRAKQSRPLSGGLAEKDGSTEEHARRVALRAVQVGEALGLAPPRLRSLATGGLLHDIRLALPALPAAQA